VTPEAKERKKKQRKGYRQRARSYVIDYKCSHPCTDCGETKPFYCLDFDHVRGRKEFELRRAGDDITNMDRIKAEIAKCDVVCKNCHATRTFMRNLHTNDELQNRPV
jgi:hypothetical protein